MRSFLRMSLALTLVALVVVIGALLLGDRIFRRTTPAVRLVYELESPATGGGENNLAAEMAAALQRRVDPQGVREIEFAAPPGSRRVQVLAPASVPLPELKRLLHAGGVLSFHVVVEDPAEAGVSEMLARMQPGGAGPAPLAGDALRWLRSTQSGVAPVESTAADGTTYLLVYASPGRAMTHDDAERRWTVKRAEATVDPATGERIVGFELDGRGAELFGELTGSNVGRMLAIALDDIVLSAPRVNSRIGAHGIISGNAAGGFTRQEANHLAATLNAGSLPARLAHEPVSQQYVTMTLGLRPATRFVLKACAILLASIALALWLARVLLRRMRPTVGDRAASLRALDLYRET